MSGFVFDKGRLGVGDSDLFLHTLKDCILTSQDLQPKDKVVSPGLIVRQTNDSVQGFRPNMSLQFHFKCKPTLHNICVQDQTLYGHDILGNAYAYSFGSNQPKTLALPRKPHGWCIVPKTSTLVHWNILTLVVSNMDKGTHEILKGHDSKVMSGDATMHVAVTGDYAGTICIWYTASWSCHYKINTGTSACHKIKIFDDKIAYIQTPHAVLCYDVTTGHKLYDIETRPIDIEYTLIGLVVATKTHIDVYAKQTRIMSLAHPTHRLIRAVHNRIWAVRPGTLEELRLSRDVMEWPQKCIEWVDAPNKCTIPSDFWPKRYLKVLAMAAPQWVPQLSHWSVPDMWFRHKALREAIWDVAIDQNLDISHAWEFLPEHTKVGWFERCKHKLLSMVESMEFTQRAFSLLRNIYNRIHIDNEPILKWCWFHNGLLCMRPILMHMTENDNNGTFMRTIAHMPSTADAICFFTDMSVRIAIKNGWFVIFVRWLSRFHRVYPHPPTHHMRQIFSTLITHAFTSLERASMNIPLPETGRWTDVPYLNPSHLHAMVRVNSSKGFITSVEIGPDKRKATWTSMYTASRMDLEPHNVEVWTYYDSNGPKTMLEAALVLLDGERWTRNNARLSWTWYTSEIGAFMAEGCTVHMFGESMRIRQADWSGTYGHFITSTNMSVAETEQVNIEWVAPLWTYCDDNACNITPLRIKVANCIATSTYGHPLALTYARELVDVCNPDTLINEVSWTFKSKVSAMTAYEGNMFVGCTNGLIYEYETVSSLIRPMRTYESHLNAIKQVKGLHMRLLSLCEEEFNIWCLQTGTQVMQLHTDMFFCAFVPQNIQHFWLVEEYNEKLTMVLWDLSNEIPVKRTFMDAPTGKMILYVEQPVPAICIEKTLHFIGAEDDPPFEFPEPLDVTCLWGSHTHIWGGTSEGTLLSIQYEANRLQTWPHETPLGISCISGMAIGDILAVGFVNGDVAIWDIVECEFIRRISVGKVSVRCMAVDTIFVTVGAYKLVSLLSFAQDRAALAAHAMHKIMQWSTQWKMRMQQATEMCILPAVQACLRRNTSVGIAVSLIDTCTEEYQYRGAWCSEEFMDALLSITKVSTKDILKRLVAFRGPRFECAICNDEENKDSIVYLQTCQHRFHKGCIKELIRKQPQYHEEMQYEYALSVALVCPTCRQPFTKDDVCDDIILNKYLYINSPTHDE